MDRALTDVAENGIGATDECIVILIRDTNLSRYSIHPSELGIVMDNSGSTTNDGPETKAYCIFIASFGKEAETIVNSLPNGRGKIGYFPEFLLVLIPK